MPSQPIAPEPGRDPLAPRLMERAAFEAAAGTPEDRADRLLHAALATLESRAAAMEAAAALRMEALAVQADSVLLGVQERVERLLRSAAEQAQELQSRAAPAQIVEAKPGHAAKRRPAKARAAKAARRAAPGR